MKNALIVLLVLAIVGGAAYMVFRNRTADKDSAKADPKAPATKPSKTNATT